MATVVVSGRIDEAVKRRADMYIKAAGKTPAQVINDMYVQISITGELPRGDESLATREQRKERFDAFVEWRNSLAPDDDWLANLTDEQMRDYLGDRDV